MMLSMDQLFQVGVEWMGMEEEVVAQRREVGCQWECPDEERKDVGCQSNSAERRDAAVQVDLLTQQLCGMAWRCVTVRADEPGGGALLQHCGTPRPRRHTIYNTLLPIMPLRGPASGTEPMHSESKDIQLTIPSPSAAPADASAAPPGLIAPLSPRLAEELEEEDERSLEQETSDSPSPVKKQPTVTAETKTRMKRKSENPVQPRSSPIFQRRSRRRRSDGELNRSEERRNVRIKTQNRRRTIQTGRVKALRKHTTAKGEEDKNMETEKENENSDEVMMKKRMRRRKKADRLTSVKMNSEVTDRPRRKAVGPPIRYLLEYEERSHRKSAASHEKGRGLRGEEEKERKEEVELQEKSNSSQEVGRGMALKQLYLSIYRKGSRRRGTTILRLHRFHHHNIRVRRRRNTSVSSGSADELEEEVKGERKVAEKRRRRSVEKVGVMLRSRRRSQREKERVTVVRRRRGRENLEENLAQRPRRTMVGPPIRYLLESEEKKHGLDTANQDLSKGSGRVTEPQKKKTRAKARTLGDRSKTSELTENQKESTNQNAACSPKRRVGRTEKIRVDSETVGRASGVTNFTGRTRRERQRQRIKRRSGRRSGDQTAEQKRAKEEREEEVKEPPQRQRRTMVGPPIRYLLESEEQSHGQDTASQDEDRGTEGATKPQKKKTGAECEAINDRSETTELTEKQTGLTNQDAAWSPKRRVARPKKVRVDSETVGKALGGTKRERLERKRRRNRRSRDLMVKLQKGEEEREEEVTEPPQRQRRTMVGPPIRYLLESEEQSHGQETTSQDAGKGTEEGTKQQKKKTGSEGDALDDRTTTTELPENQTEPTYQDAACSPKCREEIPKKDAVESESVGGASGETRRERLERKRQSKTRSGHQMVKQEEVEEERKEEVKEFPQKQSRMVGTPIRNLLEPKEQPHDWEVMGTGWELNLQEKSKSGGVTLKQETEMIDRPEDTEQKVRQAGETGPEMKTSLISSDRPKRKRRSIKVRGQSEEGGETSEMIDGTEIEGHKATRRSGRKKKRGTEEEGVRQVCIDDGGEEKMEGDRKEMQTESPKRPRRTMVGPPIRYLLESEEQSHGRDSISPGPGCMRKLLNGSEAGDGAVEDMEGAKCRGGRRKNIRDDSETGGGASEGQTGGTDTETQTSPNTQTHLIYFDPQSGQVTVFSPCCVRLQRLP